MILIKLVGRKGQTHDELPPYRSGDWKDSIWCEGGPPWVLIPEPSPKLGVLAHKQFLKVNMLINKRKDISVMYIIALGVNTLHIF